VFPREVRERLTRAYSHWLEHEGTYEEYKKELVNIYSEYLPGVHQADVQKACQSLVPFHAKRTYIFSEELIQKLRAHNYYLMVISGSPQEVVEEYNHHYLHFDLVYGSSYEVDEKGVYTGNVIDEPVRYKGRVVKEFIERNAFSLADSYGMGDTESDAKFLSMVEHPIAFNPNQNLHQIAEAEGWRIIVEKKDVIYEIRSDGHPTHEIL
jgi:HAD superfamily phosphoserine phosphatase-like hydrolase